MSDIVERAKAAHARRWEQPGGVYPQTVPSAVVELGDWASEELPELITEVERLQHELRDAARRIKAFAKDNVQCPACGCMDGCHFADELVVYRGPTPQSSGWLASALKRVHDAETARHDRGQATP